MPSLLILRHAKARSGHPDHDRPLSAEGIAQCSRLAAQLAGYDLGEPLVLCSTATRARQTLEHLLATLDLRPEIIYDRDLYLASARELLAKVSLVPDRVSSVMLVGHNPGVQELAAGLADSRAARERMQGLPTGTLAIIATEGSWETVTWSRGALEGVLQP